MSPISFATLALDCNLDKVHLVGEWLHHSCEMADPARLQELELAVVEAVTNIIKHGNTSGPDQGIGLELSLLGNVVEIVITDCGTPIPEAALEKSQTALDFDADDIANLPTCGMGLALIREATDSFDYQILDGVNTMRLTKRC
jgi:anti-sigma regulatory factor (Ser/Thr protein kinase)